MNDLKNLSNEELLSVYKLIKEFLDALNTKKEKVGINK